MIGSLIKKVVPAESLKNGDTVEIEGKQETFNINKLKNCSFMGLSYNGQNVRHGLTRIIFKVPIKNGFRYE